jgi:hypothetical protein
MKSLMDEQQCRKAKGWQPSGRERVGALALLLLVHMGISAMLSRRVAPERQLLSSATGPYL